jgi:hypothetical protein
MYSAVETGAQMNLVGEREKIGTPIKNEVSPQ